MSSPVASRRPRVQYQNSYSSTLYGMEKSVPQISPISDLSSTFMALASIRMRDKPLPPIPRRPSSAYSSEIDGTNVAGPILPEARAIITNTLEPAFGMSNRSQIPETRSFRPKLVRGPIYHPYSDSVVDRRRDKRTNDSELDTNTGQLLSLNATMIRPSALSQPKQKETNNYMRTADQYASDYQSILDNQPSNLPKFIPDSYFQHNSFDTEMSPRITDVIDYSLVPQPLRVNTPEEKPRPSSRFSSSSEDESVQDSIDTSLKARARKALHLQNYSPNHRAKSKAQKVKVPTKTLAVSRRGSNIGSATQRRASTQQGISDMHDNLVHFTTASSTKKPIAKTSSIKHNHMPKERRRPAIPITPYQKLGRKAWESEDELFKIPRWFKSKPSGPVESSSLLRTT